MKKIIITESQYRTIRKHLLESKLRSYVFDWDDNILRMPTKVNMEKNENGKWLPVKVTTEEFAHFRSDPNYRLVADSFKDFRDNQAFIVDAEKAIHNNSFAPSYKKFIEALTYGNPFAINTANPEHAKKVAIENFVKKLLDAVKKHIVNNRYKKISLGFSDDDKKNVKAAEDFLRNELSKMYPEVHFVIYDTSEGGKRKIVIEKE